MAGTLMRQNLKVSHHVLPSFRAYQTSRSDPIFQEFLRGARQLLLEAGVPGHVLNKWTQHADHELDTTKFRNWLRFRYAWGQTPSPDNVPAPVPAPVPVPIYAPTHAQAHTTTTTTTTTNSSSWYAPQRMVVVPTTVTMPAHTHPSQAHLYAEYDRPVRGLWDPPRPRMCYQQFKLRTREQAARDAERREMLVRERAALLSRS
jgi:hypothetical protein